MSDLTATLLIGVTESRCGRCRQPTMPQATHHLDVSGWPMERGRGCGARFIDTAADNGAITDWHLQQVRPDLPVRNHH